MNKKLKLLEEILQERTFKKNPVNTMEDIDNLKVLVWTFAKTGTSTLTSSFQHSIDGTVGFRNVTHSHSEACWYRHISPKLKEIDFSFELLVDFINSKGIKPLVIQSYRPPVVRFISEFNHMYSKKQLGSTLNDLVIASLRKSTTLIDYYKNTFDGIWTHDYDKDKKIGFHNGDKYDILYVPLEGINDLPKNIQSINELKEYHNLEIMTNNVANSAEGYRSLKKNIKWSEELVNELYKIHSEPLNFFYSSREISDMKNRALEQYAK